ncbi:MAG: nucleoside-diphosphate kinase [Candidatus Harrisonbacteria bacterium CG10_big_fil_rev_8_21_14_0_10_44_23]|uniref:Nucleoside diphosphate kinase n=1 Tax=Candidatus Harrisonbacteria bacterium CG10_big_fil_rev_8_21_14_0_10_44_23 TaxID=1974585 RepID=A0A2H0UQ01_9BACT|nr:MAG: nucleoside-diphosphate kinase [Candidatus Harrisonbacteria bacterium CG10_big_fil_rev_8_21_14_0_10_44_23]
MSKPKIERTLVLVKPDGVVRGLIGEVVKRFEMVGLKIVGMKMMKITPDFAKQHYFAHVEKDFYPELEKRIIAGPVIAAVLEGMNAVEVVRKIVGSTESKSSVPGTIRGDFAHVGLDYQGTKNIVHASGNLEEAEKEVGLWFSEKELFEYKTMYEKHIEEE